MKKSFVVICLLLSYVTTAGAQSIWDRAHLARVKESLAMPAYATAYQRLLADADDCMRQEPLSVMMKEQTAVSGDRHDYLSLSRRNWRNSTASGCRRWQRV